MHLRVHGSQKCPRSQEGNNTRGSLRDEVGQDSVVNTYPRKDNERMAQTTKVLLCFEKGAVSIEWSLACSGTPNNRPA